MNKHTCLSLLFLLVVSFSYAQKSNKTIVSIQGEDFYINGKPTYQGVVWNGARIEGLLLNSRMVQGIFDDLNPATQDLFKYPDTQQWDADRNTNEFVEAMDEWHKHGLLAFTLNLQGGSPTGYGNKAWRNSAFDEAGNLRTEYMVRLNKILKKANELGMVVILGYFYFGQDQYLKDEKAVVNAVHQATDWLLDRGYRNVLVEVNNECNVRYDHAILQPERIHELINLVKRKKKNGNRLLVSTSYGGGEIPRPNVVGSSDFLLLHGNGVKDPDRITQMVQQTRKVKGYQTMPILFNEDDHYDFDKAENNFVSAVKAHASWGFFDYRKEGEVYKEGYQSVPVDWAINSTRKKDFFNLVKEMTSATGPGQSDSTNPIQLNGELKKWHKITLTFDGPDTGEMASDNPFLHYRLDVTFTHQDQTYTVPGFYAADGNAAETGGDSGNKWMVRFSPDKIGVWEYSVLFKKGKNIAVAEDHSGGESAGFIDGATGSFTIEDTDKTGIDNRVKGRLNYIGEPYLRFEETGQYFIKVGVDAPENLLAYTDFDATPDVYDLRKTWSPHQKDFAKDAREFLWQGEKGKNLLGAINYLASEELNVFSFLTFNVDGDDRNVFPYLLKVPESDYIAYANVKDHKNAWETLFHKTRFDVSKLEQWERIFDYAERKGMFLHFKTHETETDHLMDQGRFGSEGKLYYRELIARFGHHLAMNWNLGEENNQPLEEVKKVAKYVHQLDPYQHHLVIHTFPNQDDRYAGLIGDQSPLTGASLQLSDKDFRDVHQRVLKWQAKSDSTGRPWALAVDEPGNAKFALLPDNEDPEHDLARSNALWGTLMAGGYGVEWYFGYNSPNSDLTAQDFRSRDAFWDQNRYARHFFEQYIPFWNMAPSDDLTTDTASYCFAEKDQMYVVYLPPGAETTSLNIGNPGNTFTVQWYDPRQGGALQNGSIKKVKGGSLVDLGVPPSDESEDWVVLLQKQ